MKPDEKEAFAKLLYESLERHGVWAGADYLGEFGDGTEVIIDGHFNLQAVANEIFEVSDS